tara:strand:- start:1367 stop:2416 length:1050 start_codon:yes stop_codon:yes gene_type:complete
LISIIIPVRNELNYIRLTLDSILKQNNSEQIAEILIVDGLSDDGTREVIKNYIKTNSKVQLIDNPDKIVSTGFNRALSISKGDVILRVDGHSHLSKDFINSCMTALNNVEADCVGGATEHISSGLIGNAIKLAQSSGFGVGGVEFRKVLINGKYVDTLAFGAYKREVFEKIGGYDEELVRNQDDEFNFRLIQNGGKIWLDPSIKSFYYSRKSLLKLFKQYFQYGFYKIRVMQKRRDFSSWRHIIPLIFVFSILIFLIFGIALSVILPFYLFILFYSVVNLFAVLFEMVKMVSKNKIEIKPQFSFLTFIFLPLVYFILHFSYGLGSFLGLIYFWNKWNDIDLKDYNFIRD